MIEALRDGRFGLRLPIPSSLTLEKDTEFIAQLADPATGVRYDFFFFSELHLVIRDGMRPAMERHARYMFDDAWKKNINEGRPRTDDPEWSPLVDVEALTVAGVPALRTTHRMLYHRGREMVMGHLMIPLRDGLFETRVIAMARETGFRESVLLMKSGVEGFLKQSEYDDPAHDELFPQHCLSLTRAAIRNVISWGPRVVAPAPEFSSGEIRYPKLGCAFKLPPGFVLAQDHDLYRVGFCGTDGVEVLRIRAADRAVPDLRAHAAQATRELHARAPDLTHTLSEQNGRVLVIVEGEVPGMVPTRNALLWFRDAKDKVWSLTLLSHPAIPVEVMAGELAAAADSFRLLGLWQRLF